MAYTDLRDFIDVLSRQGELMRITTEVSTDLELAEITDRVSKLKEGNKALLFTNVKGYDMPVLINAFGSHKRMCLSLEVDNLDAIANRIRSFIKPKVPESFMEKLSFLPMLMEVAKFRPRSQAAMPPVRK